MAPSRSLAISVFLTLGAIACSSSSVTAQPGPDAGAGPDADTSPKHRAFATSTKYNGDLRTAGGGTNGLEGGDKLCQSVATAAGLTGTFKAWLSDARTNAIDRLKEVGGWYTVGPFPFVLFASKAALTSPAMNGFTDEKGTGGAVAEPWTGTKSDGTKNAGTAGTGNCMDWTANSQDWGTTGESASRSAWTDRLGQQCQNEHAIYCFEQ